jgi:hypothetical protein
MRATDHIGLRDIFDQFDDLNRKIDTIHKTESIGTPIRYLRTSPRRRTRVVSAPSRFIDGASPLADILSKRKEIIAHYPVEIAAYQAGVIPRIGYESYLLKIFLTGTIHEEPIGFFREVGKVNLELEDDARILLQALHCSRFDSYGKRVGQSDDVAPRIRCGREIYSALHTQSSLKKVHDMLLYGQLFEKGDLLYGMDWFGSKAREIMTIHPT